MHSRVLCVSESEFVCANVRGCVGGSSLYHWTRVRKMIVFHLVQLFYYNFSSYHFEH